MLLYHYSRALPIEELYDIRQDVLDEKPEGLWLAEDRDWIKYMEFEPVHSYRVELKGDTYEENNLLVFDFADMDNIMKLLKKYHARYRKGSIVSIGRWFKKLDTQVQRLSTLVEVSFIG